MRRKIYISGKITGLDTEDVVKKFNDAENHLKASGWDVVNPLMLDHSENERKYWQIYMKTDIKAMLHIDCNHIYMLPCWQDSPGARVELQLAIALNYSIIWGD